MNIRNQFLLDSKVTFLNHGSFGACPKEIFSEYQSWQKKLENQPVKFLDQYRDFGPCLLYTSPSPRDRTRSRMPSSA